jgi:carboxyl-terminal processing protease
MVTSASMPLFASDEMVNIFENVWRTTKDKISPPELDAKFFSVEKYKNLKKKAGQLNSLDDLSILVINPFLDSLHVSHTQFLTKHDLDYYLFKSMFGTRKIEEPQLNHIGAQFIRESHGLYRIKAILEGYPAEQIGLKRGDLILSADNLAFRPIDTFADGKPHSLKINRNGKTITSVATPIYESLQESFLKATKNSEKIIRKNGKLIGYIHLWSGTNDLFRQELEKVVAIDFANTDGLILDIRNGYGGAWYEYLDPFFKDRITYFHSTITSRDGQKFEDTADPIAEHPYYKKPMVLLINEGVRSGKEALAYQFKKTRRAMLVGTKTPGYFSTGEINFIDRNDDFCLYVSIAQIQLDGNIIEQVGIRPDIEVLYPITHAMNFDPQLRTALRKLF